MVGAAVVAAIIGFGLPVSGRSQDAVSVVEAGSPEPRAHPVSGPVPSPPAEEEEAADNAEEVREREADEPCVNLQMTRAQWIELYENDREKYKELADALWFKREEAYHRGFDARLLLYEFEDQAKEAGELDTPRGRARFEELRQNALRLFLAGAEVELAIAEDPYISFPMRCTYDAARLMIRRPQDYIAPHSVTDVENLMHAEKLFAMSVPTFKYSDLEEDMDWGQFDQHMTTIVLAKYGAEGAVQRALSFEDAYFAEHLDNLTPNGGYVAYNAGCWRARLAGQGMLPMTESLLATVEQALRLSLQHVSNKQRLAEQMMADPDLATLRTMPRFRDGVFKDAAAHLQKPR